MASAENNSTPHSVAQAALECAQAIRRIDPKQGAETGFALGQFLMSADRLERLLNPDYLPFEDPRRADNAHFASYPPEVVEQLRDLTGRFDVFVAMYGVEHICAGITTNIKIDPERRLPRADEADVLALELAARRLLEAAGLDQQDP